MASVPSPVSDVGKRTSCIEYDDTIKGEDCVMMSDWIPGNSQDGCEKECDEG